MGWHQPPTGDEIGQLLLRWGRQRGREPGIPPSLFLYPRIVQQAPDNGALLDLTEPLTDEGRGEIFFTFQMIIVRDAESDHLTQHLALQARREGRVRWYRLQKRGNLVKQCGQLLVLDLVVLDHWPRR